MPLRATTICLPLLLICLCSRAAASDWKPIDPAHLTLTTPVVERTADAEALLWEVRVADDLNARGELTTTFQQYLRIKVFTDRGRESYATVDIPYTSGMDVVDVAARTVRPDGTIVELKKSDVYRRTLLKANDLKVNVVSFAVPAIERGVIVEYRWREVFRNSIATNLPLRFSRGIPIHLVEYYVRPIAVPGVSMMAWPFNGKFHAPERQKDGSSRISLSNVAADRDDAYALPPFESRPWVFISYELDRGGDRSDFYKAFGKALHEEYSRLSKPNDDIRALAATAVANASSDPLRVAALLRAAREKVRRIDTDTADPEDRRKAKETKNASDALKRGIGTAEDVTLLFLALARAAGLDARVAASPNRGDLFRRSVQPHRYFFRGRLIAVKSGPGWIFVDPSSEHAAPGELPWQFENQEVLVADPREVLLAETPLSLPEYSTRKRTGTFRLLEDGTLEGEAKLEYTGHWASMFREQEDDQTPAEREKDLRQLITSRIPNAEVSNVRIEHVTDANGPYTNVYRIRIPAYAQRTGSRMFLQPAIFQKGIEAVFRSAERTTGIYFPFPWLEDDSVTIELPAGFVLEEPSRPAPIDAGAFAFETRLAVQDGTKLVLRRNLAIGRKGAILFDVSTYAPLRTFFDAVHAADAHTLVLRRTEGGQ